MAVLQTAADSFERPAFPCALIAGDVVLLHLLHRKNLLHKVPILFVDTLHLFPETHELLKTCEVGRRARQAAAAAAAQLAAGRARPAPAARHRTSWRLLPLLPQLPACWAPQSQPGRPWLLAAGALQLQGSRVYPKRWASEVPWNGGGRRCLQLGPATRQQLGA
jgi:hypothetical protein